MNSLLIGESAQYCARVKTDLSLAFMTLISVTFVRCASQAFMFISLLSESSVCVGLAI